MDGCLLQHTYCIRQNITLHTSVLKLDTAGVWRTALGVREPEQSFLPKLVG